MLCVGKVDVVSGAVI